MSHKKDYRWGLDILASPHLMHEAGESRTQQLSFSLTSCLITATSLCLQSECSKQYQYTKSEPSTSCFAQLQQIIIRHTIIDFKAIQASGQRRSRQT